MASNNDPAAMSRPLLQQRDATGQNPSLGTGIQQPATTTQPGMASFGSPPSPQRQQGRQQPPITMQPIRGRTFDVRLLHSSMQPTYYSLSSYHKSGPQLLSALHDVGGQIMQTLDTTSTATKSNMTFEDLLQSLAHDGETVLTNDWRLLYNKATIYDCEVESTPPRVLEELPCGGAVLTNKRLLLMSASVGQGFELVAHGQTKKMRSYALSAINSDNIIYKPLPLRNVASVELNAATGGKITATLSSKPGCCCGLCPCLSCCCQSALKQWQAFRGPVATYNSRVLKIGLRMPPWDRRVMLHLEVSEELPLSVARDFIVLLQRYSPINGSL